MGERKLLKLDSMSLAKLPPGMVTFEFVLPDETTASMNLTEILTLGDCYENPHSITRALDQISAFKAFWSAQLSGLEAKIDQQKERVGVVEAGIKVALAALLPEKGRKPTVDGLKDAFQETAVRLSLLSSDEAKELRKILADDWGKVFRDGCQSYRVEARRLRKMKMEAVTLHVIVDALSNRSFALSKMADLVDIMLKQGLIQGDEGVFPPK